MLRIPLPNAPAGSVMEGMGQSNALSNQMIDNQIKQIEAQYAPYNRYADAASKIAYAQFVGPQSIASILNNPATRGMFNPQQYQQLANAFSSQVSNPASTLANLPSPSNMQPRSPFGRLLDYARGIAGGGAAPTTRNVFSPQPQQLQQSQQVPQAPASSGVNSGYSYDSQGNNVVASPQEVDAAINRGMSGTSPTYERFSSNITPGTYGATSPSTVTQVGEKALEEQGKAEARAITDQWQKRQDEIRDQSAGSIEMENQLDRLKQLRGELSKYEKGFPLGYLPGVTSAAQESGLVENNLIAARLKAWQSNRITNMDIGFGKGMKPGRWMNDESFNNEVNYETGLSKRLQEYSVFSNVAQKKGLSPSQADAVWIRYANEQPFYDPKKKQILHDNLDSWENYLTKDSIDQTFSPSYRKQMEKYKNNMAGANPQQDQKIQQQYSDVNPQKSGAKLLAKKMEIPKFNNQQEFLNWYNKQDKFVQHAVRIKLGEE
jgi:hypothetical protein